MSFSTVHGLDSILFSMLVAAYVLYQVYHAIKARNPLKKWVDSVVGPKFKQEASTLRMLERDMTQALKNIAKDITAWNLENQTMFEDILTAERIVVRKIRGFKTGPPRTPVTPGHVYKFQLGRKESEYPLPQEPSQWNIVRLFKGQDWEHYRLDCIVTRLEYEIACEKEKLGWLKEEFEVIKGDWQYMNQMKMKYQHTPDYKCPVAYTPPSRLASRPPSCAPAPPPRMMERGPYINGLTDPQMLYAESAILHCPKELQLYQHLYECLNWHRKFDPTILLIPMQYDDIPDKLRDYTLKYLREHEPQVLWEMTKEWSPWRHQARPVRPHSQQGTSLFSFSSHALPATDLFSSGPAAAPVISAPAAGLFSAVPALPPVAVSGLVSVPSSAPVFTMPAPPDPPAPAPGRSLADRITFSPAPAPAPADSVPAPAPAPAPAAPAGLSLADRITKPAAKATSSCPPSVLAEAAAARKPFLGFGVSA